MHRFSLLLTVAVFAACASSGGTAAGNGNTAPAPSASNSARLSLEEVTAADLPTAYELVERLRRPWLRRDANTSGEVVVYMDNQKIGGAEKLREIPAVDVAEMVYMPNDEAMQRWGSDIKGSVIVITRRR